MFRRIRRIIELTPALITHYEAKRIYNALTRSRVGLMFIYMLVDIWKREDEARWKAPAPSLRSGDLIYDIENHEVRIRADAAQRLERSIERTNPAWLSAYLSTQPRDGIVRSGRSQWWIQRIHENKV